MGTMLCKGHEAQRSFFWRREEKGRDGTEGNELSHQEPCDPVCVHDTALGCCNPRGPNKPGCSPPEDAPPEKTGLMGHLCSWHSCKSTLE